MIYISHNFCELPKVVVYKLSVRYFFYAVFHLKGITKWAYPI